MAPAWYKSRSYRARTIREPRPVLAEFGLIIPEEVRPLLTMWSHYTHDVCIEGEAGGA